MWGIQSLIYLSNSTYPALVSFVTTAVTLRMNIITHQAWQVMLGRLPKPHLHFPTVRVHLARALQSLMTAPRTPLFGKVAEEPVGRLSLPRQCR